METSVTNLAKTAYLDAIFKSIDQSVIATDQDFHITYWNQKAAELFGLTPENAPGHKAGLFLKLSYINDSAENAPTTLLEKGGWKGQVYSTSSEGRFLLLDASVSEVQNDYGERIGYVGIYRDITDTIQTKNSLSTFLSVLSSLDDCFFVVDQTMRITWINEKTNKCLLDIYGVQYEMMEDVSTRFPVTPKKRMQKALTDAFENIKTSHQAEVTVPDGRSVWIAENYLPVKDDSGTVTNVCVLIKDISTEKQVEQMNELLYRSRRLFETFMENSPLLAWINDAQGVIRYVNPAYLQLYNLPKSAIGKKVSEVFTSATANAIRETDRQVLLKKDILRLNEQATAPDGREHFYRVVKFPVLTSDETFVGGWAIDITEEATLRRIADAHLEQLKASERDLKTALEKEHQLHDMKSRFVSMASHEFRTPLSTIFSSIYLLEKYTTTEQQPLRVKHIVKIKESVNHMNSLLEDFLSIGKLEEGKIPVQPKVFNLKDLIRETIAETQPQVKAGQAINVRYEGSETITSDKKILKTILTNLLSNALKFSGEKDSIAIAATVRGNQVNLCIRDMGIGISKSDQQHLFETFYRGRNAQNIQGTGLGLHIVKRYIQLLGGEIWIESKLGVGTTISVQFPAG